MSRAVYALPRAEVRTSAGFRSVPGTRPGTSISAVRSQDLAAAWMRAVTALWPRVATPKAQQVARVAPESREPVWQAAQVRVRWARHTQVQADRVDVLFGLQHGSMVEVEPPQPGVVTSAAPSSTSRVLAPQEPSLSCI